MYRLPVYGHNAAEDHVRILTNEEILCDAQTCGASTTLLCLNGLKSSLTFTGVLFLMGLVPKNGFGV